MKRWEQGRATVEDLIQRREVEKVPASADHAQAELAQTRQHLASAKLLLDVDPVGAYSLAYDAARKALAAVLMNQGRSDCSTRRLLGRVNSRAGRRRCWVRRGSSHPGRELRAR